jgi:hypothetical protein
MNLLKTPQYHFCTALHKEIGVSTETLLAPAVLGISETATKDQTGNLYILQKLS